MIESTDDLRAQHWLIPPGWLPALSRLVYPIRHPGNLKLLAKNRPLVGLHRTSRRCFVIGNGPSLKTQNLRPLANETVIVANSFFQHPDQRLIAPKYHCVGDIEFVADRPNSVAWLRELEAATPASSLFFSPVARSTFAKHGLFQGRDVYHIAHVRMANSASSVSIDITRPLNVGHSTGTGFAIPLALCLGFREVYLIGFDANWFADVNKGAVHFYDTNKHFPHFDHTATDGYDMESHLYTTHLEFRSHRLLRDKASLMGCKILNATNGGWLDMYPRVEYESLFKQA
jgi:hypothetical protein